MGKIPSVLLVLMTAIWLFGCGSENDSNTPKPLKTFGIVGGDEGLLLFTEDKGTNWTQMAVPEHVSGAGFAGVAFSPKAPSKVWATAQGPNAIMTSDNYGKNWTLYEGDLHGCEPVCVESADTHTAWVTCSSNGNQPFALKTEDGGTTWIRQNAGPPLIDGDISLQGLCVVNSKVAWMSAGYGSSSATHGLVLRTIDSGDTWESKVKTDGGEDQLPPDLPYLSVAATSADEAWVVSAHNDSQGSSIYYTADGGSTWSLQGKDLIGPYDLNDIRMKDGVLWIAGDNATVFRYADGGTSWDEFNTAAAGYNLGIAALDGTAAWAVSSGNGSAPGDIVHTGDSGKNWESQSYPMKSSSQFLADVAFESEPVF